MGKKLIATFTCLMLVLTSFSGIGRQKYVQAAETTIYKLDLSKFMEGEKITDPKEGLARSGDADISVTGSQSIYISNRKDNWDALDIQNDFLNLERDATYSITVTGHVDNGIDTKNASVKLGGVTKKADDSDGYPEFIKEKLNAGQSFTLSYELKISDQIPEDSRDLWVLRVQTDEDSGSKAGDLVPYYIDDIEIIKTSEGTTTTTSETIGDIRTLYDLVADKELKVGEALSSTALKESGDIKIVVVEGADDKPSLQLKDRANNWDGLDISLEVLKINDKFMSGTYTIEVKGHIEAGFDVSKSRILLGMTESPWGELTTRVTPETDGSFVLTYTKEYTAAELANLGYSYRIQTPPSDLTSFYIDSITVLVQGAKEGEETAIVKPEWDLTLDSIKAAYAKYFMIGNIIEPNQIENADTTAMFKHHYDVITAENSMKPDSLSKEKGIYNFENADKLVAWAKDNGIKVHGHTLVWHAQSAPWLTTAEDGSPLTRAQAKANMEDYINNVAGHYAGKVISWDVVNEAFLPGVSTIPANWKDVLRKYEDDGNGSPWYQAYQNGADASKGEDGSDYLYDAFVFTRLADPEAVLYYNDFNETEAGKREAIALMVEELNEKWKSDERNTEPNRLLVEGIGMQAHYWTGDLQASDVEASIQRFIESGAKVSVSELDIPHGDYMTYKQRASAPTKEEEEMQAELYRQLFEIYIKYSDNIERVTFWGKADSQSWRFEGYPLLFDKNFAAKQAYFAVMDVAKDMDTQPENGQEMSNKDEETVPKQELPKTDEDNDTQTKWVEFAIVIALVIALAAIFVIRKKSKTNK